MVRASDGVPARATGNHSASAHDSNGTAMTG